MPSSPCSAEPEWAAKAVYWMCCGCCCWCWECCACCCWRASSASSSRLCCSSCMVNELEAWKPLVQSASPQFERPLLDLGRWKACRGEAENGEMLSVDMADKGDEQRADRGRPRASLSGGRRNAQQCRMSAGLLK